MNAVERVKTLCKKNGIAVSKLEKDLGFGNAYISGLKKGVLPNDRLEKIADYLNVSSHYLSTGKEKETELPDQMDLWNTIKKDKDMLNALEKYIFLSYEKKKHIIDMINLLSEDE